MIHSLSSALSFKKIVSTIFCIIAVFMSMMQLYTAATGEIETMPLRGMHLFFVLVLIFIKNILDREIQSVWKNILDILLCLTGGFVCLYFFIEWETMMSEVAYPSTVQLVVGGLLVLAVLEATRRTLGYAIPVLAILFILYALLGEYLPVAGHRGYSLERILGNLTMTSEGIYGSVLGVSATYIFLFVLFGSFLEQSGASIFFINLSLAFFGKTRGGPAKVAILASGLLGTISGSAVANVCTTGVLTIPLMKRVGYSPVFAGAVEAVASTGGQIMPPVMGAAAFLIAETLQVSYLAVCTAALLPAIFYYISLWFMIDFRAQRENIARLPDSEVPDWKPLLLHGCHFTLPVLLLIYFLAVEGWSPLKSGLWAIVSLLIVSSFRKDTRFTAKTIVKALASGASSCLTVAIVCAAAGIIIGILNMTGLGLRFSQLLIDMSFGFQPLLLILTMVAGLILGMGMTSTSVYIILAVLVAPALVKMGVEPLAAHIFAFYFGILSTITPPVAVAAYAAASISKAPPASVGYMAWRVGLAGFIVPFMIIYNPVLLMNGNAIDIIHATITACIGLYVMAASVEGWLFGELHVFLRIVLFCTAILLIDSGFVTDVIGIGMIVSVYLYKKFQKNKKI